jgi:hypothetical protein
VAWLRQASGFVQIPIPLEPLLAQDDVWEIMVAGDLALAALAPQQTAAV